MLQTALRITLDPTTDATTAQQFAPAGVPPASPFSNNTINNNSTSSNVRNGIATTTNGNNGSGSLSIWPNDDPQRSYTLLYENGHVTIENSPLVITEDNEKASLGVVTRTPIVTSTVTAANGATVITNDVRYRIGADDPTDPPEKRREIGTQLGVVPTVTLPDGTIRLLIQGTVAIQVGTQVVNAGGELIISDR